ncbi:MAG: flavodoxin family protein BilS [Peptostreptococcaceae bacterium]
MKYSVVVSSNTGNTNRLGDAIKEIMVKYNECENFGDEEVIFVGFWTDKGSCIKEFGEFLSSIENKKIFLFGTAGFGGSDEYFEQILDRVKKHIKKSNTIIGTFMCQGKMPISVKERYENMLSQNPNNDKAKELIINFDKALNHPNEEDLKELEKRVLESLN